MCIGQSGMSKQCRSARSRRARAFGAFFGFLIRVSISFFAQLRRKPPSSRPAINLPGPGAMLPALSDYTRLLDTFLAGRSPRTLAACRADLVDYRRFMGASISADPLRWLLGIRWPGRARCVLLPGRR